MTSEFFLAAALATAAVVPLSASVELRRSQPHLDRYEISTRCEVKSSQRKAAPQWTTCIVDTESGEKLGI